MKRLSDRMDNKGFTLVELLLAVTILAIIVVPLLHAFVSSARVNRQSKMSAKLTTVGQDIMEGVKAYSIEDMAYEFDYPGGCTEHNGFQLLNPAMIGNAAAVAANVKELKNIGTEANKKFAQCDISLDEGSIKGTNFKFNNPPHKKYYFAITNLSSEQSSAKSYKSDVLISIDPVKYTSSGSVSNATAQHNDKLLADLSSMDTSKDAFYLESGSQVNGACSTLISSGAASSIDASDIHKDINVKVEPDGTNYKVTYEFKYYADGASAPAIYPLNAMLSTLKYSNIENVYLFYMPSYNAIGDKITFTNDTSQDVQFVLIKRQITAADNLIPEYKVDDFTTLYNDEITYRCNVTVNDNGTGTTDLKTNVDTNLAALIPDSSSSLTEEDILKSTLVGVNFSPTTLVPKSVAGNLNEDRLFDVTIDVYEAGTIDAALSGTGELPADKRLVRLKGNMN